MGNKVCQPIYGLVLDHQSQEGIKKIKRIAGNTNLIIAFASLEGLQQVMHKSGHVISSIKKTDWQAYADAMQSIPEFIKNLIRRESKQQQLIHQNDYNQVKFWEGIENSCRP